ncbi:TrmB family transcriptional regulator [Halopiger xanaduensis]|uniref:Transcriptional regulator, TrmB n=1 Tax=Halopiger xanaduensis (strain DSM 18323 / JCM 14033 / SH-6) TaxID=797210 RepID=F8D4C1_HALXS|nr:TrmB family transcriptional regulator [Halopiger xanaduensis]AEH38661.1 transcriptional regulator, TrmB [Halopiger xanaduensis SH-6]
MDGGELTATLEEAGLSPYQADAFVTLLELGSASATDVAQASSVPDPRIYDVLRGLEEKGYVETYEQDSLHARANDPADVLADLRARADRLQTAAEEIEDRWSRPDLEEHRVSIVKRLDTVLARADELIRAADNQVQVGLTPAQFDELADALETARENGVNVKVSLFPELDSEPELPSTDALARTCAEARYRTLPAPFVALIDRSWTCFAPHGDSTNQYGVIVNDRTLAYVVHWYFLSCLWEVHETIYTDRREEPPITYVDLRRCLRDVEPLLADGVTIRTTVRGYDTDTGREVTRTGTITDVSYIDDLDDSKANATTESITLLQLSGKASLTIETDDGEVTVGGWGAMLEDIEAIEIVITALE